ncbi:MAG: choice-of-anchor D domain-containing protein [Ahniella sp.]|nr:choice-of-anchor D domain-containing protein [Ahniella sp.]
MLFQEGNIISNGNTIGSQGAAGSLTFSTTTTTATDVYGIHNFTSNAWTSNNNTVGGISATNLGASGTIQLIGMRAFTGSAATWSATGNTVGGNVGTSIQLNATGTASLVAGMFTSNAPAQLTSNTIRNLISNIGTGTSGGASVIGINITAATPNHTLSQNTISNLTNTNATAASVVTGIQFTGSTANTVERNFIYSLAVASNSATAEVNGIRVAGGTTVYRNNMIAIGAFIGNAIGAAASNGGTTGVNGINEFLGTNSFFHNSVYIGGSPSAGTGASFAFNGSQTVNTRSFRDNIFWNARSNAGATGSHYAIKINGTAPNPAGLTLNNNLYFANGTGAVFGFFNSLDVANIGAWRTAVGQDSGSFESNPQFVDPTNATPDLHLHPSNPTVAEGNGVDVGVLNDFDGQTRSGLTPVDIGADAGNFVGIDLAGPNITYTALGNTTQTTDRTLVVTLTDVSGVATGGLAPRIYYRKNADAYVSQACTLATGSVTNGTWNCPIGYAGVGGVVTTDLISYFVVAQDIAGNLTSNPAGAIATDVNTVGTPPASPNSYRIAPAFSGTIPVGSGQTYLSLTNAGGLFEALNNGVATGNIVVDITSDLLAETGTHPLNRITEEGVGNYTLSIRPIGAARAISGSFNGALIRFAGANRITVDGSVGGLGTDRSLTITNTSVTTPSVVLFGSIGTTPITDGTLRNTIITNGVNTSSAVVISDGTIVGNAGRFANIVIRNNEVRRAFVGVFATGGTTPQGGTNLTYEQNTINSAGADAIRIIGLYMQGVNGATVSQNTVGNIDKANDETDVGIWLASGTINATVSRNTISGIGYTGANGFAPVGINLTPGAASSNLVITGNRVSDISTNGGAQVRGIALSGASSDLPIEKNDVQGIINTNPGTFGAYGIDVSGGNNVLVSNNFVSNVSFNMSGGGAFSTQFGVFGIRIGAGTGHRIYNNSVNLSGALPGTANSALLSAAFCVVGTTSTGLDVRDNIFANNITGGTTSIAHVPVFLPSGGTAAMNLTWNNNAYFFGTDAARQGVGQAGTTAGTNFFTTLPALAAYSSILSGAGTNDNASQASTAAVPFISATDLHLQPGSPLSTAGVPLAGVTTDIDNETRSATTPSIGADELPVGILAITPSPVDFTNVVVGATSAAQAATLSNSGAAPLTISALSAASAPFAQVGGTCSALPITINPGSNCTITYTFSPAALGSASQTISVTSNGTGATSFDLTGIGAGGPVDQSDQLGLRSGHGGPVQCQSDRHAEQHG